jgi:serine/threonine-protein kinase
MTGPNTLEKIGRYKVLGRVGKGGMGVLYRGFDPVLDREVAIKLMHADFSEDTEQMRPRFYREARAAAKLQHRNIVTIFEFAEESNIPYIVMEFLRGTSLGGRLRAQPPLTLDDTLNVVAQLCEGLSYAHDQGVVHRDVKPDNIFLLEDGSVKLLDFGIAKLTTSTLTRQGDVLGSASYMSPEQVSGSESVDGRADIFSAGVVLYELLAGRKPFEGDSPTAVIVKILKDEPAPLASIAPSVPPEVAEAVMRALQKDPAGRFQSADAFGRELQRLRRSIQPGLSARHLDETSLASTTVMKALHDDYQRSRGQTAGAPDARGSIRATPPDRPSTGQPRWLIPAGAAALVGLVAVGALSMYSRETPPQTDAAPIASPASAAVSPAADVSPAPAAGVPSLPAVPASTPAATANTATALSASSPTTAATNPPEESKAPVEPPPPVMVPVSLSGSYPFAVLNGSRTISPEATSHHLREPAGTRLRVQSPSHFLSQSLRVDGSAAQPFEYSAPGLGTLAVRSVQETCDVVVAGRKLGNPPVIVRQIAAGAYRIDIVCGGETVKSHYATVRAGQTYVAAIR